MSMERTMRLEAELDMDLCYTRRTKIGLDFNGCLVDDGGFLR